MLVATCADCRHRQTPGVGLGVVPAQTAEIDGQLVLQAAQYDLKNTGQILPLTDRARDPVQQIEAAELTVQPCLGLLHTFQHVIERIRQQTEFVALRPFRPHRVIAMLGDHAYGVGQGQNRLGYVPLQMGRQQVGDQVRDSQDQRCKEAKAL
jgi:hypothetical protein